jgi:biotin carboxylase
VSLAISAVQLDNCAVDVDLILKDGEVYVIEITGRLGANCLPQLTSIYLGANIYNLVIETAMGHDPSHYIKKQNENNGCGYAKMLISTKNGILTNIINNNAESSDIVDISFFVKPGDRIKKFTNAKDCIGQIVVKGRNVETCKKRIQEVEDKIIFEME